jgi:hypothetical protein
MSGRFRRGPFVLVALLLAVPLVAAAADGAGWDLVIDFEQSGPMRDLLSKAISVAKSFLFLSTFIAYALEAFGTSPTTERDYGAVTWRLVVVLLLLWNYQSVFGAVIGLMDRLEHDIAPDSTWQGLANEGAAMRDSLSDLALHGEAQGPGPASAGDTPAGAQKPPATSSWVYDTLIGCVQLVAEAMVFLVRWMSRILTATLYILGPLALVAAIPRYSSTGTRWFQRFVTIASWPIFSSVLLAVVVALGAQGAAKRSYLECLVASLVMLVTSLSTPVLASHVVGGALGNFAMEGFGHARRAWAGWRRWLEG